MAAMLSTPELRELLMQRVLPRLKLPDLQAVHCSCSELHSLIQVLLATTWTACCQQTGC